jgi:hypothetical protein
VTSMMKAEFMTYVIGFFFYPHTCFNWLLPWHFIGYGMAYFPLLIVSLSLVQRTDPTTSTQPSSVGCPNVSV